MKRLEKSEDTFKNEELNIIWCGSKDDKYRSIYELTHSELSIFVEEASRRGYYVIVEYIDESRLKITVSAYVTRGRTEDCYCDRAKFIFNMKTPLNCEMYLYSEKDRNLAKLLDFMLEHEPAVEKIRF